MLIHIFLHVLLEFGILDNTFLFNNDLSNMQTSFQAGVDSIYDAVKAKGSTPASKSLSDVVKGINAIKTKTPIIIPYFTGYWNGAGADVGHNAYITIDVSNYTTLKIGSANASSVNAMNVIASNTLNSAGYLSTGDTIMSMPSSGSISNKTYSISNYNYIQFNISLYRVAWASGFFKNITIN